MKNVKIYLEYSDKIAVLQKYRSLSKEYYKNIIDNDPSQKVFIKGWLKR